MRVLHLLSSTGYHGAENMAAELIRRLSALGVENYLGVFHSHEGSNSEILETVAEAVRDGTVFACRGRLDWRTVRALRRYFRAHNLDIVHSHKYKTNLYALAAAAGSRYGLISTCHNWLGTSMKMRLYAALDKRVLRGFDRVVGVSQEVLDELRRHLPADKVVKIDNGIDVERFAPQLSRAQAQRALGLGARPVVGYIGRLAAEKGISCLLQAVQRLARQGRSLDLLIAGDGEHAHALREETARLGLAAQVHFLGKRRDTPALYAAMDAFVLPSFKEAFPIVVLEALASGVAVIATRVGDIPYILDDGGCGWLVDPGDVPGLAAAIRQATDAGEAAEKRLLAGRRRVLERFSSAAMARRYHDLYVEVLARRHRRAA
jgi:glycosyltransferase involved in cell wall biosynthesis